MNPSLRRAALGAILLVLGCAKGSTGVDDGAGPTGAGGGATTTTTATTSTGHTTTTTTTTTTGSSGQTTTTASTTGATTTATTSAGTGGAGGAGGAAASSTTSATTASSTSSSTASSSASSSSGTGGALCGVDHVVISEIRTRGLAGGNDDFVELFNPTASDIALDSSWTLDVRANDGSSYTTRWTGSGATIPAHKHFLIAGLSYAGPPTQDDALTSGIKDASSVVLHKNTSVVDAICFVWSAAQVYGTGFTCEGAPADNTPHDDSSSAMSDVDASLGRKMGGCQDTDSSTSDFQKLSPSQPENSGS